jgi:UDP-N-acetylglucosamine 1-carboxyvinyltransferase
MNSYIINGGKRLEGVVQISGSKNASLPILVGSILNKDIVRLYNVPEIEDVKITLKILEHLNCKIKRKKNKVIIDSSKMENREVPEELMRKLRSSIILAGSLISRFGKATISHPGGCDIGSRPIDLHLNAFKKMGIRIEEDVGKIKCFKDDILDSVIHLDFPSVGATENIILASVLSVNKEVIIENAAMEPEIIDLCNFLVKMGAKITGVGTNIIKIIGVKSLKPVAYNIMSDRIEAGTFLVAGVMNRGNIKLTNINPEHLSPILYKLEEAGADINILKNSVELKMTKRPNKLEIKTLPYTGFPTDMQAIFGSMLCLSKGTSTITETIFENRFKYSRRISKNGCKN